MRRIDRYVRYAETMEEMMFPKTIHTPSGPQPTRHVPGIAGDADLEEDDDPLPDNDTSDDDTPRTTTALLNPLGPMRKHRPRPKPQTEQRTGHWQKLEGVRRNVALSRCGLV